MELSNKISDWIRERVNLAGKEGVVLGLSGGVDSSVTAVLCKRAFPHNTLGLVMPCFSNPKDVEYAELVANKFGIPTKRIDLGSVFTELLNKLEKEGFIANQNAIQIANIKPRLRMVTLYYFANKLNYLVVGTGNKSELMVGYFTKYGDGGVDLLPLGDLLKRDVKKLARDLGIPEEIIKRSPSAGLFEGQTDEGEIGFSYDELDQILAGIEDSNLSGYDKEKTRIVERMIEGSHHKRSLPFIFKTKYG